MPRKALHGGAVELNLLVRAVIGRTRYAPAEWQET
jgi:hypothetical protein